MYHRGTNSDCRMEKGEVVILTRDNETIDKSSQTVSVTVNRDYGCHLISGSTDGSNKNRFYDLRKWRVT
jgi:hypothetical protein